MLWYFTFLSSIHSRVLTTGELSIFTAKTKWVLFIAAAFLTCFGGALAVMNANNVVTTIALGTLAAWGLGGVIVPAATVAM